MWFFKKKKQEIIQPITIPLREFVYFDREKVEDFVSACQGGLPESHKNISAEKAAKYDFSLKTGVLGIGRRGGAKELTREEIQSETNASLFERLYHILQGKIEKLSPFSSDCWNQMNIGDFVEVQSNIKFSGLELFFDAMRSLAPLYEKFIEKKDMPPSWIIFTSYLDTLQNQQECYNILILPSGAPVENVFIASLPKSKVRTTKKEITGNYSVFGRVQRKLMPTDIFNLVDLIPGFSMPIPKPEEILKGFQMLPPELCQELTVKDLSVSYPAIILTPIAIYR